MSCRVWTALAVEDVGNIQDDAVHEVVEGVDNVLGDIGVLKMSWRVWTVLWKILGMALMML